MSYDVFLIIIALDDNRTNEEELRRALGSAFCPHAFIVWKNPGDEPIDSIAPQGCIDGKTTVHICLATHCEAPMTDMDQILETIDNL